VPSQERLANVRCHPLLEVERLDTDDLETFLTRIGVVLVVHRGHDSANTSAAVRVGDERWFVKWATEPDAVGSLESAIRFHAEVTHPAIIPLRGSFRTATGLAIVYEWAAGEVLNDPLVPGGRPRTHPRSSFARFRHLPADDIVSTLNVIIDAHVEVAERGFVAVDFYDGCLIYDFDTGTVRLCDLDQYRSGPYELDRPRQYGSTRFMAPEEFRQGATIDERTTVFNLGRTAFVLLSTGPEGEDQRGQWSADGALYPIARRATSPVPADRYRSVAEFAAAWRNVRQKRRPAL
jgi:serine/threonine protein kinase, bacterial